MSFDPLETVPAPIVYTPTIDEVILYHEVPAATAGAEVCLTFKQWLTTHLPFDANWTFDNRNRLVIGLPMRDPIVTNPGDFVMIDQKRAHVSNVALTFICANVTLNPALQYVLLVHQHRRLQRMVEFAAALLPVATTRTKVQPLLNAIVKF